MRFVRVGKWKWLRRIVSSVLVSTFFYVFWVVGEREWDRRKGDRELATAFAETDATDPDWRWDQLNAARKRPPVGQNSAELIPRIKSLSAKDWAKWVNDPQISSADPPANVRYSEKVLTEVRRDLAASAEAIKLARTLKDFPKGHREIILASNPIATVIEDTQSTRHAADLLRWDVIVALNDNDYKHIGDDLLAGLNASRSVGDEPFIISQLVRLATRLVAVRNIERAVAQMSQPEQLHHLNLSEIQDALARDADEPLLLHGVRGDRAALDRLFDYLQEGRLDVQDLAGEPTKPSSVQLSVGWWRFRGRLPGDRAYALQWMNARVAAVAHPVHEQLAALEVLPEPPNDPAHAISSRILVAVDLVAVGYWRNVAETRCGVIGIACERFRLKSGRWPETLAELCPAFLAAIPLDPFDGQPLRYAKCADGVVVHSVGPKPNPRQPPRFRAGLPDGIEIGFRLWNPEARRQPPPPEPKVESVP